MTKLELLKAIEHTTDWSYQYSDDHSAWENGREQAKILANLGITVDDLKEAKLDTTFFTGVSKKCDLRKVLLINDVMYYASVYFGISGSILATVYDKNNLIVSSSGEKLFDNYIKENLDDTYFNSVFKILWRNK